MKVIIFGMGNFGQALALSLTETGNEVIGVDKDLSKVELVKEKIAHTVSLDSTNELAYAVLPLKDTDVAIVAIGENEGAAIITTAILKKYTHIRTISRSLSPIHDTVLQAMGVHQIIHPEQEAAERLTRKLNFKKVVDNFMVDENYSISEIRAPESMFGKSIRECLFREKHKLNIITILRKKEKTNLLGRKIVHQEAVGIPTPETVLEAGDVLVVFGANHFIESFCAVNKIPEDPDAIEL
ncbi:MAG: TrkA family potassium uptake protein [Lewinellaceae bacterium]|nr:TrkA family potassium uptake protein [Lewinellaceae bacterium]